MILKYLDLNSSSYTYEANIQNHWSERLINMGRFQIDWDLIRLEVKTYYATHCDFDNEPGYNDTPFNSELFAMQDNPKASDLLAKYRQITNIDNWGFWEGFRQTSFNHWLMMMNEFLIDQRSPIDVKVFDMSVNYEGDKHIVGGHRIQPDPFSILHTSEAFYTHGLGHYTFSTSRRLTEQEIGDLLKFLTEKFNERGITLEGKITLQERRLDMTCWGCRHDRKHYHYSLELPLGSCSSKQANPIS